MAFPSTAWHQRVDTFSRLKGNRAGSLRVILFQHRIRHGAATVSQKGRRQ